MMPICTINNIRAPRSASNSDETLFVAFKIGGVGLEETSFWDAADGNPVSRLRAFYFEEGKEQTNGGGYRQGPAYYFEGPDDTPTVGTELGRSKVNGAKDIGLEVGEGELNVKLLDHSSIKIKPLWFGLLRTDHTDTLPRLTRLQNHVIFVSCRRDT